MRSRWTPLSGPRSHHPASALPADLGRDRGREGDCNCIRGYSGEVLQGVALRSWTLPITHLAPLRPPPATLRGALPRRAAGSQAGLQAPGGGGGAHSRLSPVVPERATEGKWETARMGVVFSIPNGNRGSPELKGRTAGSREFLSAGCGGGVVSFPRGNSNLPGPDNTPLSHWGRQLSLCPGRVSCQMASWVLLTSPPGPAPPPPTHTPADLQVGSV